MLRAPPLLSLLLLVGCGAKTSIPGAYEGLDVVEAEQENSAGSAGSGAAGAAGAAGGAGGGAGAAGKAGAAGQVFIVETCYRPGAEGNPPQPCLLRDNPSLPKLLTACPSPSLIQSGPILDINITTGIARCCYEVSNETCKLIRNSRRMRSMSTHVNGSWPHPPGPLSFWRGGDW